MTKNGKEFEKWAKKNLAKLQSVLLLHDHVVSFEYDGEMTSPTLMQHGFNYPYKTTAIYYGDTALKKWAAKEKEELYNCLIHELCHSVTDPLYAKATSRYVSRGEVEDERERLTDHIANILVNLKV